LEFLQVCERQRQGELFINQFAQGESNGQWVFSIAYAKPYSPQIDLL
jgi:hypothetical protein